MSKDQRYLSIPEACSQLRRSYSEVYRLVLRGELRHRRERNRWLVNAADVAELKRKRAAPVETPQVDRPRDHDRGNGR